MTSSRELKPPPNAQLAENSGEVLRAWIVDGGLEVSLSPAFEEPRVWGLLLIDIARHVSRMYAMRGEATETKASDEIVAMMSAELTKPTDIGTTSSMNN